MKQPTRLRLLPLLAGLALPLSAALADDASGPPPPPPAPPAQGTSPAQGVQPPPPPRHRAGPGYALEDLTAKLALTPDQQKTVGAAIDSARSQGKALRSDDSLSREDRREKMRALAKAAHDQIRAALNPDQQKLFDALPAPQRGGRARGPGSN